jgi:hypothetical protein
MISYKHFQNLSNNVYITQFKHSFFPKLWFSHLKLMGGFEVPKIEIGFVRFRGLLFYLQYTLHIFLVVFFMLFFHVKTYICICHFIHQIVDDELKVLGCATSSFNKTR